jgi:hypothetical protein
MMQIEVNVRVKDGDVFFTVNVLRREDANRIEQRIIDTIENLLYGAIKQAGKKSGLAINFATLEKVSEIDTGKAEEK